MFVSGMVILVDTREQSPFDFADYPCAVRTATLQTGDYTLAGGDDLVRIERKSLPDLASCMTAGRERFERELVRMSAFTSACVVVESPLAMIRQGDYRSKLNPDSFEQTILSLSFRYRVPFFFGRDRRHAEWLAFNLLRHVYNHHRPPDARKIGFVPFGK